MHARLTPIGALAAFALVLAPSSALAAGKARSASALAKLSADQAEVDSFSRVSPTQVVTFDETSAAAAGMDATGRRLGREMAVFANAVVRGAMSNRGIAGAAPVLQRLPTLKSYMRRATALRRASSLAPPRARVSFGNNFWTYRTCGSFGSPRPTVGKRWMTFNSNDPVGTLRSWGYHSTPDWAGGGWTRDQTYASWVCGWRTFRDHAYIVGSQIREQNYAGWRPRGEPNPELWRVGPWPYSSWPAYVYWWHRTR